MKPFLLGSVALCLVGAGANATALAADANPFKPGQWWVVLSTSKLDSSMSPLTTFRIIRATQQGRHLLGEVALGLGGQNIVVDYDEVNHVIALADSTPTVYGSKNTRLCVFDVRVSGMVYHGRAAHFALSKQTASFGTFFKAWATKHPKVSVQDGISAYTRALAPSDNTPCKLDLGDSP